MIKFETYHDGEFWCARGIGEDIFTQGKTFDELIENIKEAVSLHFEESDEIPNIMLISELSMKDVKTATSIRG